MKISIELDGVALHALLGVGFAIWAHSGGVGHEVAALLAALLDT